MKKIVCIVLAATFITVNLASAAARATDAATDPALTSLTELIDTQITTSGWYDNRRPVETRKNRLISALDLATNALANHKDKQKTEALIHEIAQQIHDFILESTTLTWFNNEFEFKLNQVYHSFKKRLLNIEPLFSYSSSAPTIPGEQVTTSQSDETTLEGDLSRNKLLLKDQDENFTRSRKHIQRFKTMQQEYEAIFNKKIESFSRAYTQKKSYRKHFLLNEPVLSRMRDARNWNYKLSLQEQLSSAVFGFVFDQVLGTVFDGVRYLLKPSIKQKIASLNSAINKQCERFDRRKKEFLHLFDTLVPSLQKTDGRILKLENAYNTEPKQFSQAPQYPDTVQTV